MRNLASVQKISSIIPIDGADRVVLASFDKVAWKCVVAKDDFKVGDLGVYIEIDSLVPKTQAFEFMLKCKYRVKTIKLRGVLSQGLAIPFSKFPDKDFSAFKEGDDLTEFLGITKYEKEVGPGNQNPVEKKWYDPIKRTKIYRKYIQPFFDKVDPKHFPVGLIKESDETRIQNMPWILEKDADKEYVITEKCEGCLHEDIIISTASGPKLIKEICEQRLHLEVPSLNETTMEIETKKITGFSIKDAAENWFEITLDNGETLKLTGEHRVYLPELKCWRRVDQLNQNETVLLER